MIKRIFTAPVFENDIDGTRHARLIITINNVVVVATVAMTIIYPFIEPDRLERLIFFLPIFILALAIRMLVFRRKLYIASIIMVTGIWIILAEATITRGGVFAVAYAGFLIIILYARLLLGLKAAFAYAVASILLGLILTTGQRFGFLNMDMAPNSLETIWVSQAIYIVVSLAILNLATKSIGETLTRAQKENQQRKNTEEALRQSEYKFNTAFQSSPVAMSISAPTLGIMDVNNAYLKLTGFSREEVIGKSTVDLGIWQFTEERDVVLTDLLTHGRVDDFEYHFRNKSGENGVGLASAVMIQVGDIAATLATIVDITDRKNAEEEIIRLNAELEDRVAQRTSQLEAINNELETFTYSVSHDLRAPLRTIAGFARILWEDFSEDISDKGKEYLAYIRNSSAKMGQMIDLLLEFARLGKTRLRLVTINPERLINEVWGHILLEEKKNVSLTIGNLPSFKGDPILYKTVFENLLDNALKFSRNEKNPLIEFGGIENENTIYFVKDNGVGFDMKYAGKLFGVFQRLHLEEEFEGTGIGLAMVKRIITRHGGRIWAEAKPDEGAVFYFTANDLID